MRLSDSQNLTKDCTYCGLFSNVEIQLALGNLDSTASLYVGFEDAIPDPVIWLYFQKYPLAYVYDQTGKKQAAAKIFEEEKVRLKSVVEKRPTMYIHLARIEAYLGNRVEAFQHLATFFEHGGYAEGWLNLITIDPYFEQLQNDNQFQQMIQNEHRKKAALRRQAKTLGL